MYARSNLQSASISPESASSAILSVITRISWRLKKVVREGQSKLIFCAFFVFSTLRMRPSSRLIPTGARVGVGDSSAGVMCPWLDTLDSGLIG